MVNLFFIFSVIFKSSQVIPVVITSNIWLVAYLKRVGGLILNSNEDHAEQITDVRFPTGTLGRAVLNGKLKQDKTN